MKFIKNKKHYIVLACALVVVISVAVFSFGGSKKDAPAQAAAATQEQQQPQVAETGWNVRCPENETDKSKCEMFQRIVMRDNQARVAEFAIGFPDDKTLEKGTARGVAILPLGLLIEEGVQMKIGDGKGVPMKTRLCTNAGCFAFVTLKKETLDNLRDAKNVTFVFKTPDGRTVNIVMSTVNFDTALETIGS